MGDHHLDWLKKVFQNEKIWNKHKEELLRIVRFSEEVNAKLFVVIFPNLTDVKGSLEITEKIKNVFRDQNIDVLNLSEILIDRDPMEMVVNQVDNHANESIHLLVGNRLAAKIQKWLTAKDLD